jgi:hypothetical protein
LAASDIGFGDDVRRVACAMSPEAFAGVWAGGLLFSCGHGDLCGIPEKRETRETWFFRRFVPSDGQSHFPAWFIIRVLVGNRPRYWKPAVFPPSGPDVVLERHMRSSSTEARLEGVISVI